MSLRDQGQARQSWVTKVVAISESHEDLTKRVPGSRHWTIGQVDPRLRAFHVLRHMGIRGRNLVIQPQAPMIRLDNVAKQVRQPIPLHRSLRSAPEGREDRLGSVRTAPARPRCFRMISGAEPPDEGQVSLDRGITIGYFSQDVGEMSGRSAVAEVMDGAGPVSVVAAELKLLEAEMADPDQAEEMEDIIARYGEVQGRFEELRTANALEGRGA